MVPGMPFGSAPVPFPPSPLPRSERSRWLLEPGITFLNHGSYGAVMRSVRQQHIAMQDRIEARPIEMLGRRWRALLAPARERVGAFLGMSLDSFGFVTNATEGVNAVLHSTRLGAGDELLTTSHVYNAVRNAMRRRARECDARYVEVAVDLPVAGAGAVVDAIAGAITPRTRLVVVDQVSSATALVFPVHEVIEACRARGVDVLVDAAHVPGMLEVDVEALGATYWTGNLHKWCCAPKGTAVLWCAHERRAALKPAVVSHFLDEGLSAEFDWQGTRDMAAWIVAGAAIDAMGEFGWDAVRRHNLQMAAWVQRMLCERWEVEPIAPEGAMLGSMCTVPLPAEVCARFRTAAEFQEALYAHDRIEVPIIEFGGRWHARPSAQVYNRAEEYDRLAQAVIEHAAQA